MTYTIGVDVGGTKVLGGVVDEFGAVLKTARRDTPREGGAALTQAIADVARERGFNRGDGVKRDDKAAETEAAL